MLFILLGVGENSKNLAKSKFTQTAQVLLLFFSIPSQTCLSAQSFSTQASVMLNIPRKSQFLPRAMTNGAGCGHIAWYSGSMVPGSVAFPVSATRPPISWQRKPRFWRGFTGDQKAGSLWRWRREQGTILPILHRHVDLHFTQLQSSSCKCNSSYNLPLETMARGNRQKDLSLFFSLLVFAKPYFFALE